MNQPSKFDLNIENILENWTIPHAIREIVANALDEQKITNTKKVEIFQKGENTWSIRDYGRGLQISNLVQNENKEKKNYSNLIGQFGIGLKDALATFKRNQIDLKVQSKHFTLNGLEFAKKEGFGEIETLHAIIEETTDSNFIGTEFTLTGVTQEQIKEAKDFFLDFQELEILDTNKYGQIIQKKEKSWIFLNGIKINEEEKFLFSYNVTYLNSKIRKSLNRERTNVGRQAYSDSLKLIIKNSTNQKVWELLGEEFQRIEQGTACEEISWIDIQEWVIKHLNASDKYIFVTVEELKIGHDIIDEALANNKKIIIIPDNLKSRLNKTLDFENNKILTFEDLTEKIKENFEYKFVNPEDLTEKELLIFHKTQQIIDLIGGKPRVVREIKISETMQKDTENYLPVVGIWKAETGEIIIKRDVLKSLEEYAGTLIHELSHAKNEENKDKTREFENELTNVIGLLIKKLLV